MKLNFSVCSMLGLLVSLTAFGQVEIKNVVAELSAPAEENSLLWEISGNGLKQPSYLYGTIHMIPEEDFFLTDATKAAFEKSQKVIFEVNTEDMFDLSTQFSLLLGSFMDGGKRLRDLISKEDYKLVEAHFNKIGMPLLMLERVKPMILSVFAAEDLGQGGGMEGLKSYELELTEMARDRKKPIDGLETLDYQMSMFDSIPYEAQARMLVESIKSGGQEDGEGGYDQMIELYKNQDLKGMEQMILSESDGIGQYDRVLLVNRNRNWIPKMAKTMSNQPIFFAVGAGHLGGKTGVINLLREKGYEVKAVR